MPQLGFDGRLSDVGMRALRQSITEPLETEMEFPTWAGIVSTPGEVVYTHNIGFRPTGLFREAYVAYLEELNQKIAAGADVDAPMLRIEAISSWFRAWQFMEECGWVDNEFDRDNDDDDNDAEPIEDGDDGG